MTSSPGSRSDCQTCRSTKPSKPSTSRARRRNASTSSVARSGGTRRRERETYIAARSLRAMARDDLSAYERRFRRAGLPLFIEDYSPYEDIFTRAVPLLSLVFVAQVLGAVSLDWSVWVNLAAVAGGMAILLAGIGLINRR